MERSRHPVPVDGRVPSGRTNAYLLGRDPALLVDPAAPDPALERAIADRGTEHLVVTHGHRDHVGAVDRLVDEFDLTCWALEGHADRFERTTGVEPDEPFADGDRIPLGDDSVRLYALPGHAPDHVGLGLGAEGPICCGDCAVAEGSVAVAGPEADMGAYLASLRRLAALDPPALYPGHGPVIDDPTRTIERLLSHRLEREDRVRAAVESGHRRLADIVEASYEKDLSGVEELARETVGAHLRKLDADGVLAWDGQRARPVDDSP
ncbi:MBL fold metallo-hydrolase [Halovivax limisalsi]|uniref:MBL fold metallo-hydrolase n=1 Tax=Halovivax limisalsi TaxID=1453760 RepID=UPI001FFD49FD|nr:MBL fold metallo-hydrolase [Halovivax limisalsi]